MMIIAVDLGMTNIDLVVEDNGKRRQWMLANRRQEAPQQLQAALDDVLGVLNQESLPGDARIGVTGGRYRQLPDDVDGRRIRKVDEMCAVGFGGLTLAGVDRALVVSAGTGTAMVNASWTGCQHVTGSAVGGGTLLGLARVILGTADVDEINALALRGDASAVDVTLTEAVGGEIGRLPADANAVNLGKLAGMASPKREDLAAGLVRLVAQVISVIAINAARAESLTATVMLGHLMDLEAVRREVDLVGRFYDWSFTVPDTPGFGTALGVLAALKREIDI
jgi:type II pantothenate kinase